MTIVRRPAGLAGAATSVGARPAVLPRRVACKQHGRERPAGPTGVWRAHEARSATTCNRRVRASKAGPRPPLTVGGTRQHMVHWRCTLILLAMPCRYHPRSAVSVTSYRLYCAQTSMASSGSGRSSRSNRAARWDQKVEGNRSQGSSRTPASAVLVVASGTDGLQQGKTRPPLCHTDF